MGKGVGTRDISFLYDVASHRKPKPPPASKHDKSAVRLEGAHQVGDVRHYLATLLLTSESSAFRCAMNVLMNEHQLDT